MTEEQHKEAKELHEQLVNEYELNLDDLPKQTHKWVDRGLVLSCEGAGHPNHRHYKMRK